MTWTRLATSQGGLLSEPVQALVITSLDPALGSLDRLHMSALQTLSEVSPFQRDRVAAQLMQPGYVRKLLELFSVRRLSHWQRLVVLGTHDPETAG